MWRYRCWLTLTVFQICSLCPLVASKWIDETSECVEGTFEADPYNPVAYLQCLNGNILSQLCPKGSSFDPGYALCVAEDISLPKQPVCEEGDVKVDPADCSGYLQCLGGAFIQLQCANGSFFNSTIGTCVIDIDGICEGECIEGLLIENMDDCAEYFECINGKFVDKKCPSGSYFNDVLDSCVIDSDNVCSSSSKQLNEEDSLEAEYVDEAAIEEDSLDDEYVDEIAIEELHCTEGDVEEDPYDFTMFFKCMNGEFLEFSCPNGHYFDIHAKECIIDSFSEQCTNGDLKEDDGDIAVYFKCINGQFFKEQCAADHFFEPNLKKCIGFDEDGDESEQW